jgi:ribosomal protein S12 methylthiotransferase accessory factor
MNASLQRFLDVAAEYLIDSRVGIVRSVVELPRQAGAPDLFRFTATSARSHYQDFVHSGGASLDRATAIAKAIGEVIERYCSGLVDPDALPLSSYRAANFACVRPSEFALYSAEQHAQPWFPFARLDDDTAMRWAKAVDLTDQRPRWVPAAKVFVPYPQLDGERPIAQSITTGLASHSTWEDAAINAICEVIERDAFTIAWQARLAIPHIDLRSLGREARDLAGRFRCAGDVQLFNLTLDHGVPTILATLRARTPGQPALVFAAAAELDPARAAVKSLEELELMRSFACHVMATRPALEPAPDYRNIWTRDDHVHFYCAPDRAALASFLFDSSVVQRLDELPVLTTHDAARDLEVLVERIRSVGERVLIVDLTSPEIAALGLTVVRAIIPGFHPLVFGHVLRACGGTRLWRVPQALGYAGITPASGDNPVPHPFP